MIGAEVPRPNMFGFENRRNFHRERQRRAIAMSALEVVKRYDTKVAKKIGIKGERTILEEMEKIPKDRDPRLSMYIYSEIDSYKEYYDNYFVYSEGHNKYKIDKVNSHSQRLILEAKGVSLEINIYEGKIARLEALTYGSNYHKKELAMGEEEGEFLSIGQSRGSIRILPLGYDVGECGEIELSELQGIYVEGKAQFSVEADDKANKLIILCEQETFDYPIKITPETLFEEFEERLKI
jgi:hypothetical protein